MAGEAQDEARLALSLEDAAQHRGLPVADFSQRVGDLYVPAGVPQRRALLRVEVVAEPAVAALAACRRRPRPGRVVERR